MRTLSLEEAAQVAGGETGFQIIDPMTYLGVDDENVFPAGAGLAAAGGVHTMADPPVTVDQIEVIAHKPNNVIVVRSHVEITFSAGLPGWIGGGGTVSGTIPAGATFEGVDKNHNNIPDAMDYLIRTNRMSVRQIPPGSHK